MHGPDLAGIVLLLGIVGLAGQALRLAWRWRIGRPARVDWLDGLRRLPHAYFHTVHDIVARDAHASRMHALAAGGLVGTLVVGGILHVLGPRGPIAVGLAAVEIIAMLLALVGTGLVVRRRLPPRLPRLDGGRFDRLPWALAGTLVFLGGSAIRVAATSGAPAPASLPALALSAVGLVSLGTLVVWCVDGPMRHALAGVVNLIAHPRPARVAGRRDAALTTLDLSALHAPGQDLPIVGAGTADSFAWPRLAQFDACVRCGRCQEACPAHAAGQPLDPRRLIQDLVGAITSAGTSGSEALVGAPGISGAIEPETLWACTTCRACVHECPMLIEHVDAIVEMRRFQTLERGTVPQKTAGALQTIRETDTAAGRGLETRLDWAVDLRLPLLAERGQADVLLWLGDAAFDRRGQRSLRALIRLLRRAGVDFAVLGEEERDCGDLARRLGDEITFQALAAGNIATLARYRFARIVTADPHAYNILRNEYPALGGRFEVLHHSVFLDGLFAEGRLVAGPGAPEPITYHDPCYLGRYNGEVEAPRRLLGRLGATVSEMKLSGLRSRCCGGGGGAPLADIPGDRRIPDMRMDQARETGAATVAVACPTCALMLEGVVAPRPAIADLAELALASVEAGERAAREPATVA